MKNVMVTGGGGFIGSHLVDVLLSRCETILIIEKFDENSSVKPMTESMQHIMKYVDGGPETHRAVTLSYNPYGLCSSAISEMLDHCNIDTVFHLAANPSVAKCESSHTAIQDNFETTVRMINEVNASSTVKRFVYAASGGTVYGEGCQIPSSEYSTPRPSSEYGLTKHFGELWMRQLRPDIAGVSLRLANVYGQRQNPHGESGVIAAWLNKVANDEPLIIYGDGNQTRDYIHVDDVVTAFIDAVSWTMRNDYEPGFDVFNIGTEKETTINELYDHFCAVFNRKLPVDRKPEREFEIKCNHLKNAKASRVLGWCPRVELPIGLAETVGAF